MSLHQAVALVALVGFALWQVGFYLEGHRPRGSIGLKTFGAAVELLVWITLAWAVFS